VQSKRLRAELDLTGPIYEVRQEFAEVEPGALCGGLLASNGSECQIDLAELTSIDASTLSRIVTRLVREGQRVGGASHSAGIRDRGRGSGRPVAGRAGGSETLPAPHLWQHEKQAGCGA
jgi:hypothetical protein